MKSINVIHCADIHLGTYFTGLENELASKRREEIRKTFLDIIELCKSNQIHILLVVGDLFEGWTINKEIFSFARNAFADIPNTKVVISGGNHDPLTINSPYDKKDFWSENVYIMETEYSSILFDDIETEVWGVSFSGSNVDYPLLKKSTPQKSNYIQIGAIHGTTGTSNHTSKYNPISLNQIAESGLDYLALGHIHKYQGISKENNTYYAYSGCPEGRGFDELEEKTILMGTISKNNFDLKPYKTSQRMYLTTTIDISEATDSRDIIKIITSSLKNSYGSDYNDNLYKIFLEGSLDASINLSIKNIKSSLKNLFYAKFDDRTSPNIDLKILAKEKSMRGIFVSQMLEKLKSDDSIENKNALKLGLKAFAGWEVEYSGD